MIGDPRVIFLDVSFAILGIYNLRLLRFVARDATKIGLHLAGRFDDENGSAAL